MKIITIFITLGLIFLITGCDKKDLKEKVNQINDISKVTNKVTDKAMKQINKDSKEIVIVGQKIIEKSLEK